MENFTPVASGLGGMLIGLSASLLLLINGRVAGISGIVGGLLQSGEKGWRAAFVAGLLVGGVVIHWALPSAFRFELTRSLPAIVVAGLLVGFGTRMGNGCTSGHGVCGISRGSKRSLVATAVFMTTGALVVYVINHVLGARV